MEGATHFIELYKRFNQIELHHSPNIFDDHSHASPIEELQGDLEFTKSLTNIKTVAVWYIKPKTIPCKTIPNN